MTKNITNKIHSVITYLITSLLLFGLVIQTNAQSAGTLSFSPNPIEFEQGGTESISVIYTGTEEIVGAEVHVNVGSGLTITNFNEGSGLVVLFNSPETGRMDIGSLSEDGIVNGTTLFTMEVQATNCTDGQISFSPNTLIPDTEVTLGTASYTCTGGDGNNGNDGNNNTGATQNPTSIPNSLPKTSIFSEEFDNIILASFILSSGFAIAYYMKMNRVQKESDIEILVKDK